MDTRTPRTPDPSGPRPGDTRQGGQSGFFGDEPGLSTVKVPSDPAEVVVTHASFRVQLAPPTAEAVTGQIPAVSGAPFSTGTAPGPAPASAGASMDAPPGPSQRAMWGVRTEAEDTGATRLSHVARPGGWEATAEPAASTTQVLPRIDEDAVVPTSVVGPRGPGSPGSPESTQPQPRSLLYGVRPARGAFDGPETGEYDPYDEFGEREEFGEYGEFGERGSYGRGSHRGGHGQRPLRHPEFEDDDARSGHGTQGAAADGTRRAAYYPGRRMNLGVVLLPLRIFLGFISVYAGVGKLCDPVYFDGGDRGSMVTWLRSLEPWAVASPLRDFALAHPVGSGLTVAFAQIIIGVLTVCGLWQRLAASIGALLSAALLMTVSWSAGPAYEAPDIIYLAAWSPLVIAGAPVYSVDGRLAADSWRKLGPRAELWELRRRVLRRGTVIASVVTGVAMLTGSMLGGAVRSAHTAKVPQPGEPPTNQLPGSPLPEEPGARTDSGRPVDGRTQGADAGAGSHRSGGPSSSASPGDERRGDTSRPSQRETVQAPQQTVPGGTPPRQSAPGTRATQGGGTSTGGGAAGGAGGGSNSGGGGGSSTSGGGGGGSYSGGSGGGLGGLLG
ncbi:DoxX family protein [Streptomyces winkii]|uniref:DoxX family protein n=1 Tax=Streptomyces winkii TaxID=3051178 RepID=UPI0028D59F36|nr:DoxX family membrane protein [Streptomyces sp. DSM 40971]